ncbi:MAG: hypothetical protein EOM87_01300 [Clostridia bacterium]|nr:hypothetical protein [Clostridia bacterium]
MYIALGVVLGIIGLFILTVAIEIILSVRKKPSVEGYKAEYYDGAGYLLYLVYKKSQGTAVDEGEIDKLINNAIDYVSHRYDCSDFRVVMLVRILKDYSSFLSAEQHSAIKACVLGFRYWMDQANPGDSLCMWSENHQLIFAVSEYVLGDMYSTEIFTNDNKTGAEHKTLAEARIDIWLQHRFDYGYSEWNSSNYFPETLAPMANFIQYSKDEARVKRMKMALDALLLDVALGSFRYKKGDRTYYIFNTTSGRAYADNKISDRIGNLLKPSLDCLIQGEATRYGADGWEEHSRDRVMAFRLMLEAKKPSGESYYELPQALRAIFDDNYKKGVELKQSNSLNLDELVSEGLIGLKDKQIMMQLGMEVFTDYRAVNNTIMYIRKNGMLTNTFVAPFRYINSILLIKTGILKALTKRLPMLPNGAALQRANIYTYKTSDYCMSTAQRYGVGGFCGQQHIWSLNITDELSIFTTQPAKPFGGGGSPSYWIGNGRCPHSAQYKNINLSLYKLPVKRGIGESDIAKITHAYCPLQFMEEYCLDYLNRGFVFGKAGNAMFMLRSNGSLSYRDADESIKGDTAMRQKVDSEKVFCDRYDLINAAVGEYHYWITEVSTLSAEKSFTDFIERCLAAKADFIGGRLVYNNGTDYSLMYDKEFSVDNKVINTEYQRYENRYVKGGIVERKPQQIIIECKNKTLKLDFKNNIREEL